jgi:transcriptional regulator GlxA family with amidase domain
MARSPFDYDVRLRRIKEFVECNLSGDLSLKCVAPRVGLTAKSLSAHFRRKTGVRYSEWVTSLRVHRAREILMSSNTTITDAAWDAGFRDLRTFERVFKRYTGMTPRDFRAAAEPEPAIEGLLGKDAGN